MAVIKTYMPMFSEKVIIPTRDCTALYIGITYTKKLVFAPVLNIVEIDTIMVMIYIGVI
jgi:hypothetical protein